MEMTTRAFLILLAVIAAGAQSLNDTTEQPTTDQPTRLTEPTQASTNATTVIPTNGTTGNTENPTTVEQNGSTSPGQPTTPPATKQSIMPSTEGGVTQPPPTKPSKGPSTSDFNAPSFIGGIVLGIAITVILAFGYGFYKTRRDKNYHTL